MNRHRLNRAHREIFKNVRKRTACIEKQNFVEGKSPLDITEKCVRYGESIFSIRLVYEWVQNF